MLYTIMGKLHGDVLMGLHFRAPIVNYQDYAKFQYKRMYFLVYDNRDIPSEVARIKRERKNNLWRGSARPVLWGHECYIISVFPFHQNEKE